MSKQKRVCGVVIAFWWLTAAIFAAIPPAPNFVSPELRPDRTVTFRILAPKASEVSLVGGWMSPNQSAPLVKGSNGVWNITVGPLAPSVYAYWFVLDGSNIPDEGNQYIRIRTGGTSLSMVEVPGDSPATWDVKDVPHGTIEMSWVKSITFGETRNTWVYLPPGYDKNRNIHYPVLYLFHGAGELHLSWTESGKANLILDNLLADNKVKPMIVVMPNTGPVSNERGAGRGQQQNGTSRDASRGPITSDYVLNELVPWTEQKYRVAPGRKNRAIAGFSAGGALAGSVGLNHLDLFSQVGMFSAPGQSSLAEQLANDPKGTNAKLDLLWGGVGKQDPLATEGMRKFDAELSKRGIRHTYAETEGAHEYSVWRWCLVQFAPLLFRNGS